MTPPSPEQLRGGLSQDTGNGPEGSQTPVPYEVSKFYRIVFPQNLGQILISSRQTCEESF